MTADGFWVSLRDKNVLKLDCVAGCTNSEYSFKNPHEQCIFYK